MSLAPSIALSLPCLFLLFLLIEAVAGPARAFPRIRFWRLLGLAAMATTLAVYALVPPLLLPWLPARSPLDLGRLGLVAALPTVLLASFLAYWAHRLQHRSDSLWRLGHQLHHSVLRVDTASAMMFHPFELIVQAGLTTFAAWALGAPRDAAALAGLIAFLLGLFPHLNIGTPLWLGPWLQRPEAHLLHHERGVHARNYGELPLWDLLFGTYANPVSIEGVAVGFEPRRSRRVLAMLAWRDVNRER